MAMLLCGKGTNTEAELTPGNSGPRDRAWLDWVSFTFNIKNSSLSGKERKIFKDRPLIPSLYYKRGTEIKK